MDDGTPIQRANDRYQRSREYFNDCSRYLAGGVSSNFRMGAKPVPLFFERGHGSHLYSVDGVSYLDYALGMGPVILGHAPSGVIEAVQDSLLKGQLYAGQHEAELRLARLVTSLVACAERVRFGCSGSEAVQIALRLARARTGRTKIVKFEGHYHGWFDNICVSVHPEPERFGDVHRPCTTPESEGQDPSAYAGTLVLPWNDIAAIEQTLSVCGGEIAGIIMEPILCNTGVITPKPGYLERVRELCTEHGIVLIFDEVITGFRVALNGAQGLLGVTPDLAIFAKAMAGGFPISCLAGRAALMDLIGKGLVMHGGTYNSNVVSVVAAIATLEQLKNEDGAAYDQMNRLGRNLMDGLQRIADELDAGLVVQGLGSVFHTYFGSEQPPVDYRTYCATDRTRLSQFVDALLDCGVRITTRGTWFLSTAHTKADVEETLAAARKAMLALPKSDDRHTGRPTIAGEISR
jgi:glutamate-1-semialdehyde 2,1-aminomutase